MKRRLVIGKQEPDNGVYIQHINGKLYPRIAWDVSWNANANGVAVVLDETKFVIAKIASTWSYPWSSNTSTPVRDITTTTDISVAIMDYSGLPNTNAIIAQLSDCPSANYCRNYTFPTGKRGYLPSLGELYIARNNKLEIDASLNLIGGNILGATQGGGKYMDSSTQYDASGRWLLSWGAAHEASASKTNTGEVRPFTSL